MQQTVRVAASAVGLIAFGGLVFFAGRYVALPDSSGIAPGGPQVQIAPQSRAITAPQPEQTAQDTQQIDENRYRTDISPSFSYRPGEPLSVFQAVHPTIPCETHNGETICESNDSSECPNKVACSKASYFFVKGTMTSWSENLTKDTWTRLYSELQAKLGEPDRSNDISSGNTISSWRVGATQIQAAVLGDGPSGQFMYTYLVSNRPLEKQLGASWLNQPE